MSRIVSRLTERTTGRIIYSMGYNIYDRPEMHYMSIAWSHSERGGYGSDWKIRVLFLHWEDRIFFGEDSGNSMYPPFYEKTVCDLRELSTRTEVREAIGAHELQRLAAGNEPIGRLLRSMRP